MAPYKRKRPNATDALDAPPAKSTRSAAQPSSRARAASEAQRAKNSTSAVTAAAERVQIAAAAEAQSQKKAEKARRDKKKSKKAKAIEQEKAAQRAARSEAARERRAAAKAAAEQVAAAAKAVSWEEPLDDAGRSNPIQISSTHAESLSPDSTSPIESNPAPLVERRPFTPPIARQPLLPVEHWEPTYYPSSPPAPSSPFKELDYEVSLQYTVFVNGLRKAKDIAPQTTRLTLSFVDIEDTVEALIASPQSTVDG